MDKIPLSVVVMTRNEEKNITGCLDSVAGWVSEIVIVDDHSTDNTLDIVRKYTNKIHTRKWEMEGIQRNFAYAQAGCDYILSLDADERITDELKESIISIFHKGLKFEGYNISHRNYLGNYWIRHGGWYPNSKLKLFKKGNFRYEESEYHPRAFLDGKTSALEGDIIHYNYPDFHAIFAKLNHQTDYGSRKWLRENRRMSLRRCIRKMITRFIKYYFVKKGCLDGFVGLFLALYSGMYQFHTYCKYWAFKKKIVDISSGSE